MANKTRLSLANEISDLCDQHGCNDKIQKLHHAQFVDKGWNPHPPQAFINWWGSIGIKATEKATGRGWGEIDAIRAFNCEAVREVYREAKNFGLSQSEPIEYSES